MGQLATGASHSANQSILIGANMNKCSDCTDKLRCEAWQECSRAETKGTLAMPLDLDQLEALLEKAPPLPWFQCDEQPYLHCSKDGTLPVNPKPWDYAVVGRFDYSKGAMDAIAALRNAAPQLIAQARRAEKLERLVRGFLYYARIRTVDGVTCHEHGSHTELVRDADALLLDIARPALKESP